MSKIYIKCKLLDSFGSSNVAYEDPFPEDGSSVSLKSSVSISSSSGLGEVEIFEYPGGYTGIGFGAPGCFKTCG